MTPSDNSSAASSTPTDVEADRNRVRIFDTTLRDGEQSPGASMNMAEKLELARALAGMGVDVIEAGFPIASVGDFDSVRAIAAEITGATVCGLARCNDRDIDRAWEAVQFAQKPRIHVFLATSAIHREHKLRMTRAQIVERAVAGVRRAAAVCKDVEFSPEDAARTEIEFLREVIEAVIDAGATTVNIPDTVGYAMPSQYAAVIRALIEGVPNIGRAVISTHCHDDLGLAVANSLAGVEAGARQVECTINGIGERAGNAALEEIVMALKTRHDYYGLETNIKTERLFPVSRMLSSITGMAVQRNKAIVGSNAFAHEAGIHQDGMLKERSTYEIMRPEDVGVSRTDLVLGKHSGRHALRDRVVEMGYTLSEEQIETLFHDFKALADKKKEVYDEDVAVLVEKFMGDVPAHWQLLSLHTTAGTSVLPTATVSIRRPDGEIVQDAAIGDGPVDAIFKAVERVTGVHANLHEFVVRSVSQGKDAQGEVTLELEVESGESTFRGRAASTDIIEASALAYLNAVNAITTRKERGQVREVVGRPGAGA
ncbi:2-isopropylmalate synthase [Paludisphaera borealis]|uniref:2-isopropylmalate synthase n=1 Tax=Paludisphaera borealis TaxID=1387353 RepID=A0A1U7CUX4_9BACT|nr:2-isopropylmalate synthase [Paludisphaera borealis]APW62708.1 2-isopropylmalate synthase [Paludisphaera borealis]